VAGLVFQFNPAAMRFDNHFAWEQANAKPVFSCLKGMKKNLAKKAPALCLTRQDFEAHDFARLTFGDHFKRAAADLAIGGEPLAGDGGIHRQFERLAAKRALDVCKFLHV
jgi:hypothetical protein